MCSFRRPAGENRASEDGSLELGLVVCQAVGELYDSVCIASQRCSSIAYVDDDFWLWLATLQGHGAT